MESQNRPKLDYLQENQIYGRDLDEDSFFGKNGHRESLIVRI